MFRNNTPKQLMMSSKMFLRNLKHSLIGELIVCRYAAPPNEVYVARVSDVMQPSPESLSLVVTGAPFHAVVSTFGLDGVTHWAQKNESDIEGLPLLHPEVAGRYLCEVITGTGPKHYLGGITPAYVDQYFLHPRADLLFKPRVGADEGWIEVDSTKVAKMLHEHEYALSLRGLIVKGDLKIKDLHGEALDLDFGNMEFEGDLNIENVTVRNVNLYNSLLHGLCLRNVIVERNMIVPPDTMNDLIKGHRCEFGNVHIKGSLIFAETE